MSELCEKDLPRKRRKLTDVDIERDYQPLASTNETKNSDENDLSTNSEQTMKHRIEGTLVRVLRRIPLEPSSFDNSSDTPRYVERFVDLIVQPLREYRSSISSSGFSTGVYFTSDDARLWRHHFQKCGYLLVRNYLPRKLVERAREVIIKDIATHYGVAEGEDPLCPSSHREPVRLLSRIDLHQHPLLLDVFEHEALFQLAAELLKESDESPLSSVATLQYKWLRAVPQYKFTGLHRDRVYFPDCPTKMITIWLPLGDISLEHGALTILPGSHVSPILEKARKEQKVAGTDGTESGWLTTDPNELAQIIMRDYPPNEVSERSCILEEEELKKALGHWCTTTYHMGDVVVLHMDTFHQTLPNHKNQFRLSCDLRFIDSSQACRFATTAQPRNAIV